MNRRRIPAWSWILLALLVLGGVAGLGLAAWVADLAPLPVHVVLDGEEIWSGDASVLGEVHPAAVAGVLLAALVGVAVAVPVALAVAFAGVAVALVAGLGVPLLALLLVAALALSPLIALAALGVWLWRRSAPARPANIAP